MTSPPIQTLLVSSALGSYLLHYLAYFDLNVNLILATLGLFFGQLLAWTIWTVMIYPQHLSPLRHLPGPKVNLPLLDFKWCSEFYLPDTLWYYRAIRSSWDNGRASLPRVQAPLT